MSTLKKQKKTKFFAFLSYSSGAHYNALYDAETVVSEVTDFIKSELGESEETEEICQEFVANFKKFADEQQGNSEDVNDFWTELYNLSWVTITFNPNFGSL